MPASTAVLRDRKFAPPEAPNRLAEPAPPPKAAPASAPLPCCMRIRPIMPSADRIWTASRMVNKTFIFFSGISIVAVSIGTRKGLGGRGHDLKEVGRLERRAADEATVDVGLGQQAGRVGRVHAAAVQDVHPLGGLRGRGQL